MESLATVGELEVYLGHTVDDPAQAQALLDLSSSAVRTHCGWDLSRQMQVMYAEGTTSMLLTLPTLELIDVLEVRCGGVAQDLTQYPVSFSRKGQVWGCWVPRAQYELDVVHGYDPIPDVLKLITMDLTNKQLSNPESLTSATVGQVTRTWGTSSTTTASAMSTLQYALLDRYSI